MLDQSEYEYIIGSILSVVEQRSGQNFEHLRSECLLANKKEGRYPKELREKIARVRRAIEGMDSYERITRGQVTALGYRLNTDQGLNLPWEIKSEIKAAIWGYLEIDSEKDKDSIGMSIWKAFYDGAFWSTHRC